MSESISVGWEGPTRLEIRYTGNLRGDLESLPRLATVIKRERAASPGLVLVDTGDFSAGTELCERFEGRPVAEVMNHLDYDAAVPGESEARWGREGMERLAVSGGFPFLAANWPGFTTHKVVTRGELEITLAGLGAPNLFEATDPVQAVRDVLAEVGDEGVLIVLSQLGFEGDRRLAMEVEGIHAILQGVRYDGFTQVTRFGETLLVPASPGSATLGSLGLDLSGTLVIESEDES